MRAMVLTEVGKPLQLQEVPKPVPQKHQALIKVEACGVCRTDLHIVTGELPDPKLPLIPGHQIVGRLETGERVGVPWLGGSCGKCRYCKEGRENLCDQAIYTGYQIDGGFAEYVVADKRYIFSLPEDLDDVHTAPLLCAGLIGYRALRLAGEAKKIGFYGFGVSAHILIQIVNHRGGEVYAFTREGDSEGQAFARSLGAVWSGDSKTLPPEPLDAAIVFASVGALVPQALQSVRKGGSVVCAGIHMSEIPAFSYDLLWEERLVRSVANLTRQDGEEFFPLANEIPIQTKVNTYPLEKLNDAIEDLQNSRLTGAAVIVI